LKTGDNKLDELNVLVLAAKQALKQASPEEEPRARAALVEAERAQAAYWQEYQAKARAAHMKQIMARWGVGEA
jgi:hypothetical protein